MGSTKDEISLCWNRHLTQAGCSDNTHNATRPREKEARGGLQGRTHRSGRGRAGPLRNRNAGVSSPCSSTSDKGSRCTRMSTGMGIMKE